MSQEEKIKEMTEALERFSDKDFASFVPTTMLRVSEAEKLTAEFVFWFCHIVEQDLDKMLKMSAENTTEILGPTSKEIDDFVKDKYGIKLVKVDPDHPDYDPSAVTFGDRIFFVEKMRGKTPHVRFLWKVKKIRDDLSHGRIKDLRYENDSLIDITVKRKIMSDYVTLCLNIGDEEEGGLIAELTDNQRKEINALWEKHKSDL